MKNEDDVKFLEKLIVQLQSLHSEISQLTKKSPNDGLNLFKLNLVNKVLLDGNKILTKNYKPFEDFDVFDEATVPTNSDVTMILALYMEQAERYRSDNVIWSEVKYDWLYVLNGKASSIQATKPTQIGASKK